ncbi:MAG: nucleoside monophosphate kinase [Patescibacteria group bacterium]
MAKFRIFCVIGKSGSGKGTQIELLKNKLKPVKHIYSGDMLRAFIKQDSALAKKVSAKINKGYLAPDWLTDYLWQTELLNLPASTPNIIFEGTPRTIAQALVMDEVCQWMFGIKPIAIHLDISDQEAKKRLLKRLVCKKCGQPVPYKLLDQNPKICPVCGGPIIKRKDDNNKAILNRLKFFKKEVLPTIDYYKTKKRLIYVNGKQDVPEVFKELWSKLKKII